MCGGFVVQSRPSVVCILSATDIFCHIVYSIACRLFSCITFIIVKSVEIIFEDSCHDCGIAQYVYMQQKTYKENNGCGAVVFVPKGS